MSRNHMNRRKGELTGARIDREWPYQVALLAEQVAGKNYVVARDFCRDLSLCPRGHTVSSRTYGSAGGHRVSRFLLRESGPRRSISREVHG
jgi:hypothetical protein